MFAFNSILILELTELGQSKSESVSGNPPLFFSKLFCHLKSEKSNTSSPLISLSGPETAQALSQNLSWTGAHNASSITRASSTGFSFYRGGPLQRPGPLSFHIHVPAPVIWLTSAQTLPHSRRLSLAIVLTSHLSWFCLSLPSPPLLHRCFLPLMRSELVSKIMKWPKLTNQRHILELTQYKNERMCSVSLMKLALCIKDIVYFSFKR